jgi:hypothetical protein
MNKRFFHTIGMERDKLLESLKDPDSRLSEILFGRRLYSYFSYSKVIFRELENFIFFKLKLIPKRWSLIDSPIIKKRIALTGTENVQEYFDEGFSLMVKMNYRLVEDKEEIRLPDVNMEIINTLIPLKEKSDLDFIKKIKKEMKLDKSIDEYNRWVSPEVRETDQMRELTSKGFSEQKSAFLLWIFSQSQEQKQEEEEKKEEKVENDEPGDDLGVDLLW